MNSKELLQIQLSAKNKKPKGVRADVSAGISYYVELRKMIAAISKDINSHIMAQVRNLEPEYTRDSDVFDGWVDLLVAAMKYTRNKWSDPQFKLYSDKVARKFITASNTSNRRKSERDFGINIYADNQQLNDYLQASIADNVNLITSIPDQYLTQVESIVLTNVRAGRLPSSIAKLLRNQYDITDRRAKMIARDQTAKVNGDLNRLRQTSAGFKYFQWMDSDDERVRDRHAYLAEHVTTYGKGIYRWDSPPLSDKGVPIIPGSDYQCFTGDSPLNIFHGVKKAFRHWYSGELSEFITSSGERFKSTPNHPVLTDRGWVAACALNLGDKIFRASDEGFNIPEGYTNRKVPIFSEFFKAAQLLGVAGESALSLGGEFHGDSQVNQNIDVVRFDLELGLDTEPSAIKEAAEFIFALSEKVEISEVLPMSSDLHLVLKGFTGASDGFVSGMCKLESFLSCGFAHADVHRFAAVWLLYSTLVQDSGDYIPRNIKVLGDCLNAPSCINERFNLIKGYVAAVGRGAFNGWHSQTPSSDCFRDAVGVTPKKLSSGFNAIALKYELVTIVDKSVGEFSGHVYNLEMENGLFVSQGIAVSNCRCVARPVDQDEVDENRKAGLTAPGVFK
jgi:SPP1 gp7 family putative phage head morphogenesis protein